MSPSRGLGDVYKRQAYWGIYTDFLKENSTLAPERIDAPSHAVVLGQKHDVSRDLKMTRPAFGVHLMASIICHP